MREIKSDDVANIYQLIVDTIAKYGYIHKSISSGNHLVGYNDNLKMIYLYMETIIDNMYKVKKYNKYDVQLKSNSEWRYFNWFLELFETEVKEYLKKNNINNGIEITSMYNKTLTKFISND